MKTIANIIHHKEFPLKILDSDGNELYYETSNGYWEKLQVNSNGNRFYWEDSGGYWVIRNYDSNGNTIYYENSHGDIEDCR